MAHSASTREGRELGATLQKFEEKQKQLEKEKQINARLDEIKNMSHEDIVKRITTLTSESYATKAQLQQIENEIKECEKDLNIKATPENIVEYKKRLDGAMRTALSNLATIEETLLEEVKDMHDDARRKWLEDIINESKEGTNVGNK